MAVKNFVFRENWVSSKVAGMRTTFLPFLTLPGPTFWPQKAPISNSFRNIFVKKGRNYIISFVTLRLTKRKFLKIISFLSFLTKIGQKLTLMFFRCCISSYICLKFPPRCFYNYFFLF